MAQRIEVKTIVTPRGTAIAAPLVTPLTWRQGYPVQVEIRIPPGPSGLLGVALAHSGTRIIPHDESEWLITDAEPVIWPLTDFPTNAAWSVITYNLDVYAHTIQVRMLLNEIGSVALPRALAPVFEQQTPAVGTPTEGSTEE